MAIETAADGAYRDRKVGLIVFGVLQICLGALCALAVPVVIFGVLVQTFAGRGAGAQVHLASTISGVLLYVAAAVWFLWMGIGSIMCRRWARRSRLSHRGCGL